MNDEQLKQLVETCETQGRSFGSVRREHGDEVYRAVRDACVANGRGTLTLYDVEESDGEIRGNINPSS